MQLVYDDKVAYQIATWLDQHQPEAETWLGFPFHFLVRTHVTSTKHYDWKPVAGQDLTMEGPERDFWQSRRDGVELELIQMDKGFGRDPEAAYERQQLDRQVFMYEGLVYSYAAIVDFTKKRNAVFSI